MHRSSTRVTDASTLMLAAMHFEGCLGQRFKAHRFVIKNCGFPRRSDFFMARMVKCKKLGQELPGLTYKPWPNELGQRVYENISQEAWGQWLEHFKRIMNEYRLNPAD